MYMCVRETCFYSITMEKTNKFQNVWIFFPLSAEVESGKFCLRKWNPMTFAWLFLFER